MLWKILLFTFILAIGQLSAYAHVDSSNNGVNIMMHINPNDTPTMEQTTDFNVYFNDAKNQFRLENCDCKYKIESNYNNATNLVIEGMLSHEYSNDNSTRFAYDFKDPGSYKITFVGEPKTEIADNDKFSNFQASFDLWVNQKTGQGIKDSILINYFAYLLITLTIVYFGWLTVGILRHLSQG